MTKIVVICVSFFAGVMATKWFIGRHHIPGVLNYKESREFERKIANGLRHPVGLVPTPKADQVIKKIIRDVLDERKEMEK